MRAVALLKTVVGGRWSVPMHAALRDAGHEVTFALPGLDGPLPDLVRAAGMEVVHAASPVPGGAWRQAGGVVRLRRQLLEELRADVVVSHLHASAIAARLALRGSGVPHVYMPPGPLVLESPPVRLAERALSRLDAHVICTSTALARGYGAIGYPPSRTSTIHYSVDPTWPSVPQAERSEARRRLDLDPDGFVACCVAWFYAPKRLAHRGVGVKGHDVLLEAWASHRASGAAGELLLVGSGFGPRGEAYRRELRARYASVPGVRWIDHADDVRPHLGAADLSITPSRSENLGGVQEPSLLGIPSLASDVGGIPDLVHDGTNGWLVPPGDPAALARGLAAAVAAGPDERARRGELARRRARELFDEATNTAAFADVVEQVLADRG